MFLKKDDHYWLNVFYQGTLLTQGWNSLKALILEMTPDHAKVQLTGKLDCLGEKIGREWSKDNQDRRISNSHLMHWADVLKTARSKDFQHILETLEALENEVNDLLR